MKLFFPPQRWDIHLFAMIYTLGIVAIAALGLWSFFGGGLLAGAMAFTLTGPAALFVMLPGAQSWEPARSEPAQRVNEGAGA